jgi:hypothetical protein
MMPEDQAGHSMPWQICQLAAYDARPHLENIKVNLIYWVAVARNQATRLACLAGLLALDIAMSLSACKGGDMYACILLGGATYFINLWVIGIIVRGEKPGGEHARQDEGKDQRQNQAAQGGKNCTKRHVSGIPFIKIER